MKDHRSERHFALNECPPCTGVCNQGRTCSARQPDFVDTEPTEETEQQQAMPFWESVEFIGAVLLAFWAFLAIVNWLAEQAHGQ